MESAACLTKRGRVLLRLLTEDRKTHDGDVQVFSIKLSLYLDEVEGR